MIYHGRSSVGIDYDNYDFALQEVRKFAASGKDLEGVRMYMSVGTEEEFDQPAAQWQLTSSFYRMVKVLKAAAIPGLELITEVFPGENHSTVLPLAFMHGVQAVLRSGTAGA